MELDRCIRWDATSEELESEDFEMFLDTSLKECLENYKQVLITTPYMESIMNVVK